MTAGEISSELRRMQSYTAFDALPRRAGAAISLSADWGRCSKGAAHQTVETFETIRADLAARVFYLRESSSNG
jgi:hypothetical protein